MDIGKLIADALSKESGEGGASVKVLSGESLEDVLKQLGEEIRDGAGKQEMLEMANRINPVTAARMATVCLLQSNLEHNSGHEDCATFQMEAADVWLRISDSLLNGLQYLDRVKTAEDSR